MRFRWARVRRPEWIAGAGGLVLFIGTFLLPSYAVGEYSTSAGPRYYITISVDAWTGLTHTHWLLLLTLAATLGLVIFQATRAAPALPVTFSWVVAVLGPLTVLALIYRDFISAVGSLKPGAWFALIGACLIAVGGILSLHEEGIATGDLPEIPTIHPGGEPAS
jgi:hypothetical protein